MLSLPPSAGSTVKVWSVRGAGGHSPEGSEQPSVLLCSAASDTEPCAPRTERCFGHLPACPTPGGVTVYRDQLNQKLFEQVVTASAVLTFDYDSYDLKKMMKELQDHVEKVTVPYRCPHKMKIVQ